MINANITWGDNGSNHQPDLTIDWSNTGISRKPSRVPEKLNNFVQDQSQLDQFPIVLPADNTNIAIVVTWVVPPELVFLRIDDIDLVPTNSSVTITPTPISGPSNSLGVNFEVNGIQNKGTVPMKYVINLTYQYPGDQMVQGIIDPVINVTSGGQGTLTHVNVKPEQAH